MNELETAIYEKLTGGTALTALLAGTASVYNEIAPRGAAAPYVIFGLQAGGDENMIPVRYKNYLYRIKAVSETSMKNAGQIDAQIDALMHDTTLTVSGWQNFWCMRESDFRYVETTSEGRNIWHAGGVYRIRLCKI